MADLTTTKLILGTRGTIEELAMTAIKLIAELQWVDMIKVVAKAIMINSIYAVSTLKVMSLWVQFLPQNDDKPPGRLKAINRVIPLLGLILI